MTLIHFLARELPYAVGTNKGRKEGREEAREGGRKKKEITLLEACKYKIFFFFAILVTGPLSSMMTCFKPW